MVSVFQIEVAALFQCLRQIRANVCYCPCFISELTSVIVPVSDRADSPVPKFKTGANVCNSDRCFILRSLFVSSCVSAVRMFMSRANVFNRIHVSD